MNRLVDWSDALLLGVPEIDAHHRALASLLNELHETVHRRRGAAACRTAVEKLRHCALSHLDVEERLMHAAGHATFAENLDEQRELLRLLDGMLARMDDEASNITFQGLHQLKVWLLNHMRAVDAARTRDAQPATTDGVKVFGVVLKRA